MFIAMNRFKIGKGSEAEFENIWRTRESRLDEMEGFKTFHLLRGAEEEDHTLYSSHTVWDSRENFEAWTKSQQFRDAHKNAGSRNGQKTVTYLEHPKFEGFEEVKL